MVERVGSGQFPGDGDGFVCRSEPLRLPRTGAQYPG